MSSYAYSTVVSIGDAEFMVAYDYHPEEKPVYNLDSPVCGPGYEAHVELVSVTCNDSEMELLDLLAPKVLELIEEKILVEISE